MALRLAGWRLRYAAAAFVGILAVIGGAALFKAASHSDSTSTPVATPTTDCNVATTVGPDGFAPPCPDPRSRSEVARAAALDLLGEEGFAGLWNEPGGSELVLGYVGDPPSLADLPGVDRLAERELSLAELEAVAAERNEAQLGGLFWRVDVRRGVVEGIPDNKDIPKGSRGSEL